MYLPPHFPSSPTLGSEALQHYEEPLHPNDLRKYIKRSQSLSDETPICSLSFRWRAEREEILWSDKSLNPKDTQREGRKECVREVKRGRVIQRPEFKRSKESFFQHIPMIHPHHMYHSYTTLGVCQAGSRILLFPNLFATSQSVVLTSVCTHGPTLGPIVPLLSFISTSLDVFLYTSRCSSHPLKL